jgi:SpoVK/Ycf46/Vps4 family AAA+-type ATPase
LTAVSFIAVRRSVISAPCRLWLPRPSSVASAARTARPLSRSPRTGDVGTGKTALAESVGDSVARQEHIDVTLYPLSLATRGSGKVGEITQLLSAAFDAVLRAAEKLRRPGGKAAGGIIFLVDEADAVTQSREAAQMHHEDRAGVRIDELFAIERDISGKPPTNGQPRARNGRSRWFSRSRPIRRRTTSPRQSDRS